MTPASRTPYDVFQEAIAAGIQSTVHDCWTDFACWEVARSFADDPGHPAKAAIEWITMMEDMRGALDEFTGETKAECLAALDSAYQGFAKLEHSEELVQAIEKWMAYRQDQ